MKLTNLSMPPAPPVDEVVPAACPAEVPIMARLVETPVHPVSLATTKGPWGAPFGLKPSQPAVCVPRRFSVGTMMILVTALPMLLGILKLPASIRSSLVPSPRSLAASERVKCCCSRGPILRRASFFGGMITFGVLTIIAVPVTWFSSHSIEAAVGCVFWGGILTVITWRPAGLCRGLSGGRHLSGAERAGRHRICCRGRRLTRWVTDHGPIVILSAVMDFRARTPQPRSFTAAQRTPVADLLGWTPTARVLLLCLVAFFLHLWQNGLSWVVVAHFAPGGFKRSFDNAWPRDFSLSSFLDVRSSGGNRVLACPFRLCRQFRLAKRQRI